MDIKGGETAMIKGRQQSSFVPHFKILVQLRFPIKQLHQGTDPNSPLIAVSIVKVTFLNPLSPADSFFV